MVTVDQVNLCVIKRDPAYIRFIKNQTHEICMEAVKQYGYLLRYVKNQTYEICMEAIKSNPCAIKYVLNRTPDMYTSDVEAYINRRIKEIGQEYICTDDENCMICFETNGTWCKLKCGHAFHTNCIMQAFRSNLKCPVCRNDLVEKTEENNFIQFFTSI
jgi:hypothetical protein